MAPLGAPLGPGDAPVVPPTPAPPWCPMNPLFQPPSAVINAVVCPHNRQLAWQLLRFEGRLAANQLNTQFHFALVRARQSVVATPHVVHLGCFHNLVWVNRSRTGQYVWHVVRCILDTFNRPGQPQCIRQFPHVAPGWCALLMLLVVGQLADKHALLNRILSLLRSAACRSCCWRW